MRSCSLNWMTLFFIKFNINFLLMHSIRHLNETLNFRTINELMYKQLITLEFMHARIFLILFFFGFLYIFFLDWIIVLSIIILEILSAHSHMRSNFAYANWNAYICKQTPTYLSLCVFMHAHIFIFGAKKNNVNVLNYLKYTTRKASININLLLPPNEQ